MMFNECFMFNKVNFPYLSTFPRGPSTFVLKGMWTNMDGLVPVHIGPWTNMDGPYWSLNQHGELDEVHVGPSDPGWSLRVQ